MVGNVRELFRGSHQSVQRQTAGGWRNFKKWSVQNRDYASQVRKSRVKDKSKALINMENTSLGPEKWSRFKQQKRNKKSSEKSPVESSNDRPLSGGAKGVLFALSALNVQCSVSVGWRHWNDLKHVSSQMPQEDTRNSNGIMKLRSFINSKVWFICRRCSSKDPAKTCVSLLLALIDQ